MPNRNTDIVFQLIKSLSKAEKRNFKLFIKRNSGNADLKIIELFDAFDKIPEYDETVLLKKLNTIQKPQLANAKNHLYKQILSSLRMLKSTESMDMQLYEQLDFAKILYNKALYQQSLKIIDRVKQQAEEYNQDTFLIQAISLEKKIETLHITRSLQNKAELLSQEALKVHYRRLSITKLSNLALQLYSWYIKNGHASDLEEEMEIEAFFKKNYPNESEIGNNFYEQLYKSQCYAWLSFIRQDFLGYYKHTHHWVDIFHQQPYMIQVETAHYIKGFHNLLNAQFDIRNFKTFEKLLRQFENFANEYGDDKLTSNQVQMFIYLEHARLNLHIIKGEFEKALSLIPQIESKFDEDKMFIDTHRILTFNYKFAVLHFGNGDYSKSIDYLQKIINSNMDLRTDLQSYARLLHLIAHYELGNDQLMESLAKSVYRFMARAKNLNAIEVAILKFIKRVLPLQQKQVQYEFKDFLSELKSVENNKYASRALAYLDIISWVESKIENKSMKTILRNKYLQSKHR